ncbi:hypothetical protein CCACVL1_22879 [Corchorus capsularis]|uniref:DC1 domain-containing protein n=1 Tax=Corchorus capsularis TaxID=210143 RepID=A0A1R3GW86_COCAP|nr:hypothetical protein CCACVL1_22879 [Corchorus capsularis]
MEMSMQEELDRPMILAVKCHLKEPRNEVAYKLAKYLKFPLIDQEEITQVLQDSQHSNDISFEIVLKIASTQLTKLKLGVILSTPISQNTHLDKLKHLAKSSDAILVIIQCLPEDASNGYEIVGVSKLTIDTEKKDFVAEDFVSKELDKVKKRIYRHLHPLIFNTKPSYGTEGHCQSCQRIIQGPSYQCILGCDEYVFDKACAELLGDLDQVRKNCPEYLRVTEPEYLFPRKLRQKCNVCVKEFSDSCHDCLFRTNMRESDQVRVSIEKRLEEIIENYNEKRYRHVLGIGTCVFKPSRFHSSWAGGRWG